MTSIINLTQHPATPTQIAAGVVDLTPEGRRVLARLLTIDEIPTADEIETRAEEIIDTCWDGSTAAMIGGAGPLMRALRHALKARGVQPLEAFSRREAVEKTGPDGAVVKTAIFVHAGWWPDVD